MQSNVNNFVNFLGSIQDFCLVIRKNKEKGCPIPTFRISEYPSSIYNILEYKF